MREKLDLLQLPLEAKRPLLLRFDPASEPVMRLALLDKARQRPARPRRSAAASLCAASPKIASSRSSKSVEGSAAVKVSGGYEDEMQVFVDQQKLAQLGLSIDAVTRRVRAENVNLSGGRLEQGTQRFLVRTLNEFEIDRADGERDHRHRRMAGQCTCATWPASTEATRIARRSRASTARRAIELAIYKEGDANTVQLANGIRARTRARSGRRLPEGTRSSPVYDQSTLHRRRDQRGEERRA